VFLLVRQLALVQPARAGQFVQTRLDFRAVCGTQLGQFLNDLGFAHGGTIRGGGSGGKFSQLDFVLTSQPLNNALVAAGVSETWYGAIRRALTFPL
jgi:hypothetical protein